MHEKILLLDCDGVLANFIDGVAQLLQKDIKDIINNKPPPLSRDLAGIFDIPEEEIWPLITEDFWANLKPYPWANDLVNICEELFQDRILICTSAGYLNSNNHIFRRAVAGKEKWICQHFKQFSTRTVIAYNKTLLASPRHILLDDYESNIYKFISFGGKAVLFPQYWNSLYHKYNDLNYVKDMLINAINDKCAYKGSPIQCCCN